MAWPTAGPIAVTKSRIPVRNIYYMFLYAWNRFEQGKDIPVGAEDSPDLINLLAKVLAHGTRELLRRGLLRDYISTSEELAGVQGRVNISRSMSLLMTRRPRLVCDFDELDPNVLPNQVLRTTLARIAGVSSLDQALRKELLALEKALGVADRIRLADSVFRRVQLTRNSASYRFLMKVCELAFVTTLPSEGHGAFRFVDALRDEKRMPLVFQAFVRNFLAIEQQKFQVGAKQLNWDALPEDDQAAALLPRMNTDIVLTSLERQIIIDTKYYASALSEHQSKRLLHSENLYQLFSYLKNAEAIGHAFRYAEGILLYPATGDRLRASYQIQGHRVTAASVNLDKPWQQVRNELLALISAE